jgi:hypothetical protein
LENENFVGNNNVSNNFEIDNDDLFFNYSEKKDYDTENNDYLNFFNDSLE